MEKHPKNIFLKDKNIRKSKRYIVKRESRYKEGKKNVFMSKKKKSKKYVLNILLAFHPPVTITRASPMLHLSTCNGNNDNDNQKDNENTITITKTVMMTITVRKTARMTIRKKMSMTRRRMVLTSRGSARGL